jgi:hypothetical protein
LIEEVDRLDPEPFERRLGDFLDVRRITVQSRRLAAFELEPELRRDHDLALEWRQRFTDELLVRERAVRFGGVEKRDAAFDGRANQRDPVWLVNGWTIAEAQSHAAESER